MSFGETGSRKVQKTTRIPYEALRKFVAEVFMRLGLPDSDAQIEADCLLKANLRGFETHGVARMPDYANCLREGRINPDPLIQITQQNTWAFSVAGDNGLGHLVANRAMRVAISAAEQVGIGLALVRESNHIGAACVYSLMAIEHDCIGIVMANSSPAVAPWGSREPFLGTNPISIAVPAGRHAPFVMDMATGAAARLKIREALAKGQTIPDGWALNADGRPTRDPVAALAGSVLPIAGAKGSALGFMIDILAGVLSGAEFGGRVLSFLTNVDKPANQGQFFLALKIETFLPMVEFLDRMDNLIERVHALPPAENVKIVRLPGERGARLESEYLRTGIPLNARDIEKLNQLGQDFAVPFPEGAPTETSRP